MIERVREKLGKKEVAEAAESFTQSILDGALIRAKVSTEVKDDEIWLRLDGDAAELLLADNARVLYALNHLVNQIFYRRSEDGCNFILDCNNYRRTRAYELELLAKKAAEEVRLSRTKISLQPMPASERRIVHLAVAEEGSVRTESEGFGKQRRVLILPD